MFKALDESSEMQMVSAISIETQSQGATERYGFATSAPAARKWVGERQTKQITAASVDVVNELYEATAEMPRRDLENDQTDTANMRLGADLSTRAASIPGIIHTDLLIAGTDAASLAYDGVPFFSSSHVFGKSPTQSNLVTAATPGLAGLDVATTSLPTAEELADVITQLTAYMYKFKDDENQPMNTSAKKFAIIAAPGALTASFMTALSANNLDSGRTNPVTGLTNRGYSFEIFQNARLSSETTFYFARIDGIGARPLILQTRSPVELKFSGCGF